MTSKKLLAGCAGVAITGLFVSLSNCTVTTVDCTKTPNDPLCLPGTDSGFDNKVTDSSMNDTSDSGNACPAIGMVGAMGVKVDYSAYGATCNACMSSSCCMVASNCFMDTGMGDHCADVDDCLSACVMLSGAFSYCGSIDAGASAKQSCIDSCKQSHPTTYNTWCMQRSCMTTNCAMKCM